MFEAVVPRPAISRQEVVTFCTERIWWIMKCRFSVCLFLIFKLEDVGRTGDL